MQNYALLPAIKLSPTEDGNCDIVLLDSDIYSQAHIKHTSIIMKDIGDKYWLGVAIRRHRSGNDRKVYSRPQPQ